MIENLIADSLAIDKLAKTQSHVLNGEIHATGSKSRRAESQGYATSTNSDRTGSVRFYRVASTLVFVMWSVLNKSWNNILFNTGSNTGLSNPFAARAIVLFKRQHVSHKLKRNILFKLLIKNN